MIRRLIVLVIALACVYAGWNVGVAWSHYRKFQDDVRNAALFGNDKTDEDLQSKVMDLAAQNKVPLQPDAVSIQRRAGEVVITAHYTQVVKILPGYTRAIDFDVK